MMGLFTSHSVLLGRMRIEADGRLPLLLLLVVLVAGASLAGRGRSGICVIVGVSSLESALEARDMPCGGGGGGSDGIMAPSDAVDSGNVLLLLLLLLVVVVIVVAVVIADFFVYFFPTSRPVWTLSFCLSFVLGPSLIPVPPHEGMHPILNKMLWYRPPKV